jgi:two-component system response regulator YesN
MVYKVLLVEDEIVTREGIRDNVDWRSMGFEFCGEAPDGEIALPLIESTQPDVIITDIRMPFMDGLQLCKIIREHFPWMKIIILSGHDEFNYAQAAVKLGVTEYLLKPVSVSDLHAVLERLIVLLDQDRKEREDLKRLRNQVDNNVQMLRQKFLLQLLMGVLSSSEAIEQSQQLGINLIANYYLVVLMKIELCESSKPFDYYDYKHVEGLVTDLVSTNQEILLAQKDMEELVLLIKGNSVEQLIQEGTFITELIQHEVEQKTSCTLLIGVGTPQKRLGDIHRSFAEALVKVSGSSGEPHTSIPENELDQIGALKLNQAALEHFLRSGLIQDFDEFFAAYLQEIGKAALHSRLVKHYVFMDIILTAAQFVSDLNGDANQVIPEIRQIEKLMPDANTIEQIRGEIKRIVAVAISFRDSQVDNQQVEIAHRAKSYIDKAFANADLSLTEVAAQVHLSPNHFSVVFSQEMGETFRDYLIRIRIERAKELLRTTSMKCYEVAYQCGYNDAHYFSHIFKKATGLSPQSYRNLPQDNRTK